VNPGGYSAGLVAGFLDKARESMPSDVPKEHLSQFFYVRGVLRDNLGDSAGAAKDLEAAMSIWPDPANSAFAALRDVYRRSGDDAAVKAVDERLAQLKRRKSR
jgi:lipoprotein NlpI